ncbi:conjugal transfer protein TraX [Peptoniphilus sp. KCTC 25270]|uniref:TraX family protein n=1 Tax=Peptoniphilus sp. KCTC 25270 TaxID=2897414 RepID=UPI001E440E4A|nr:TraX family protein [Peptoniphilus sp. KCTC 25270]MCD1147417.1 conjugal transfer protein TraX [Peptoniphilus sp. KCTC 25270]
MENSGIWTSYEKENLLQNWKREGGLSGSTLKVLACIFMLLDHISQSHTLYALGGIGYVGFQQFWAMEMGAQLGAIMTLLGRIAFPIYCFFIVQGTLLTKDNKKMILRLFLFGLISEIPFDYGLFGTLNWNHQNVFFTLALGSLMIFLIEWVREHQTGMKEIIFQGFIFLGTATLAVVAQVDYGANGIIAMLLFYLVNSDRIRTMAMGIFGFLFEAPMYGVVYLSLPLLYFYNGKRGNLPKYFFYAFYPGHLLFIYFLRVYIIPMWIG